ncbi:MAG: rhodanese-like domain-containing protein [Rhodospirillales bacterium]|nr:rhodanese-like domain-containing protein [Alphaproteobacteria bacterium]MBL6947418.1 rhodanese-like domain-containing protein [Rhodospirillales bacterium]
MQGYSEVDAVTAHQWAADGEAVIVDVREHNEVSQSSVDGAVHVPMSAFDPTSLPTDSGKKIVFICAHGHRSVQVTQYLIANSILEEAYNLTGGLAAWLQAGLPVEPALA